MVKKMTERIQFLAEEGTEAWLDELQHALKNKKVRPNETGLSRITKGYLLRETVRRYLARTVDELEAEHVKATKKRARGK